jgi:hypothetical protein
VDPLPNDAQREGSLYPDGGHIKDLKEVRELLYKMQRPGIAPSVSNTCPQDLKFGLIDALPQLVYPHDW